MIRFRGLRRRLWRAIRLGPADGYVPCDRCGRRYEMDASVDDETWRRISGKDGEAPGYLCLWCMDTLAAARGITFEAKLHWIGQAGRSAPYGER